MADLQTVTLCLGSGHTGTLRVGRQASRSLGKEALQRLLRMIPLLAEIRTSKTFSIYSLAKTKEIDVSNLRKDLAFLERLALIEWKITTRGKRTRKAAHIRVAFLRITFDDRPSPRAKAFQTLQARRLRL